MKLLSKNDSNERSFQRDHHSYDEASTNCCRRWNECVVAFKYEKSHGLL